MKLFGISLITLGLLSSFVFFIIILILLVTDHVAIVPAIAMTVAFNFLLWLVGPKITDFINRIFYKVRFLEQQEVEQHYPHIAKLIQSVADEYKFKFPKVGIIADNNPTAFTYGSARFNARLVITQGIFKYLNEDEQKAVVAHEMGHIVHRDFVVMTIASTLVQILYELYAVLIRTRGRNNPLPLIGMLSFILYWIGSYLLLFLSRTREKLADAFSAKITEPDDLATALIKIAYGIVTESDDDKTKRLLASTRHMGLVDVKDAKATGSLTYVAHHDRHIIAEAMVFDSYNPWAKLIELNSTHPLTGRRIHLLSKLPSKSGRTFSYDVDGAATRMHLNVDALWRNFFKDMGIVLLPFALFGVFLVFTKSFALALAALGLGFLAKAMYRYPIREAAKTTVLDEMRNPYASPLRGKPVRIEGHVVGRGVPGYVFGEDMMYQDKTGLIFVNYHSALGFLGNILFALRKVKKLMGLPSVAEGWFHRHMASMLTLRRLETGEGVTKSYRHVWSRIWPSLLIIISLIVVFAGR